jgi:hypothetical protein
MNSINLNKYLNNIFTFAKSIKQSSSLLALASLFLENLLPCFYVSIQIFEEVAEQVRASIHCIEGLVQRHHNNFQEACLIFCQNTPYVKIFHEGSLRKSQLFLLVVLARVLLIYA